MYVAYASKTYLFAQNSTTKEFHHILNRIRSVVSNKIFDNPNSTYLLFMYALCESLSIFNKIFYRVFYVDKDILCVSVLP